MDSLLNQQTASRFARIVLAGIHREYPNKLDHVMNDAGEVLAPRRLHPAFYGCFDWHSAVHGHWLLARLLRLIPDLPEAGDIRAALATSLTPGNIAVELAYLTRPNSGSFERTYGWAWLLKLHEELGRSAAAGVAGAAACAEGLEPLAEVFVQRYLAYLPKLDYPIRSGVHGNTAFGLAFAHDWATWAGHSRLRPLVEDRARHYYGADESSPAHMEPGGADFFSPALMEADLMRRVLAPAAFAPWFAGFLPGATDGEPASLFTPARVSDRTDLQIVHLDGLNLSRAWCMRGIAAALREDPPDRSSTAERAAHHLEAAAQIHLNAALPHISSGDYAGEHWLATFAVLALTGP
jgi:hypothetical protein